MIPSAYYDPFDVPELKTRLAKMRIINTDSAVPGGLNEKTQFTAPIQVTSEGVDPFCILPVELREMILTYVDTQDVLSFRYASRVIAATPLSQYFFQSRFWPGREFGVLFDGFILGPSRASIDWRDFYQVSKQRIKYNLVGLGERNRLRIWDQTVRPLTQAIDEVSRLSVLRGESDWLRSPKGASIDTWNSVEASLTVNPELFGELKRHVFEAEIELPSSKIEAIHVGLVEFFGKKFICGLAFETEQGEDIEIGYIIPGAEEPLLVEAALEGFHIAVDDCGFRAISPYTGQHMQSEYLDWVGSTSDLPIQTLKCNRGSDD
ncbi:hypothetical protein ONZ43_g1886 [Nemania bipapillata]|uniref:Uncharacterized protein n=1 Tax=Nemania bipapillata TaxID=110536 RepID=A0ACC2J2S1_9PEZI|nr:hypothetical protein ONZ43_g1886 [Nemania bipapillata]